jgi:hypothetical protein
MKSKMAFETGHGAPAPRRPAVAVSTALLAVVLALPSVALGSGQHHGEEHAWALHKESTVNRTFQLASTAHRTVEILNFNGKIEVRSGSGSGVVLVLHQTWAADTDAKLEEAQREVRLDATEPASGLRLVMDGPFRSHDGGIDFKGWRSVGYEAHFDFTLEVPAGVDVVAKTVQGGDVLLAGLAGHFEAANVNGAVTLERMSGAGNARTVNGTVHAAFSRNPGDGCSFSTINGQIDVTLRSELGADLRFKTINGEVYTDFPYTLRGLPAASSSDGDGEASRGRFHYRSRGEFAARIGAGGPELSFSTINGNILIHRQDA